MVTEKINQAGYLYFTAGASNQVECKNKNQFAEVMETAEHSYEQGNKVEGADTTVPEEKEISEETVSETKETETNAKEKTAKAEESGVKEDAKEVGKVDSGKVDEELNEEAVSVSVVFAQLVQQMQGQVQEQIAQELGVSIEAVQKSMQELGVTVEDLQEPQNLLKLIVDVMDLQGPQELLTNPQLTEAFKKLNQQIADMMSNVSVEEIVSADESEVEQVAVDNVMDEAAQATTQENSQNHMTGEQETDTESGMQNPVLNFTANLKMDIAQNIHELLTERVDYESSVDIVKQVSEQVKLNMRSDVTSLEMQLYPEHLGKVSIQVASKNGVLTAQIAAESEVAKVALESQIQTLKENLEQQGLKVESVEVMVSARGFEQQHDHNGDASNAEKQSKQFRGTQISEVQDEENLEESEEMKETLGNTVSYMA